MNAIEETLNYMRKKVEAESILKNNGFVCTGTENGAKVYEPEPKCEVCNCTCEECECESTC